MAEWIDEHGRKWWKCDDCPKTRGELPVFMLHNHLWKDINHGKSKGILCFECMEERMWKILGRGPRLQDFPLDIPANISIYFGYKLGEKHEYISR